MGMDGDGWMEASSYRHSQTKASTYPDVAFLLVSQ